MLFNREENEIFTNELCNGAMLWFCRLLVEESWNVFTISLEWVGIVVRKNSLWYNGKYE